MSLCRRCRKQKIDASENHRNITEKETTRNEKKYIIIEIDKSYVT